MRQPVRGLLCSHNCCHLACLRSSLGGCPVPTAAGAGAAAAGAGALVAGRVSSGAAGAGASAREASAAASREGASDGNARGRCCS